MRLLLILVLLSHHSLLKAQVLMSSYSSKMINSNFIIEYHTLPDRNFKEFIYLVQFDTLMPRLEIHFANRRDLDYFNNYLLCFLSECIVTDNPYCFRDHPKYSMMRNVEPMFLRTQSRFCFPVKVLFNLLKKYKNRPKGGRCESPKVGSV